MENQAFDRYVQSLYAQESLTPPAALESAIFARLDAVQPAARKRRLGWWMASVAGLVLAGWLVGTTWQAGEHAGAAGTAGTAGTAGAGVGAAGAGAGVAVGADVAAGAAVGAAAGVAAGAGKAGDEVPAGETAAGVEVARGGTVVRSRTTSTSPTLVSTPVSSPVSNFSSQAAPCEPVRKLEVRPFQRTGRVGEKGLVYPREEREVVAMPATITVRQ